MTPPHNGEHCTLSHMLRVLTNILKLHVSVKWEDRFSKLMTTDIGHINSKTWIERWDSEGGDSWYLSQNCYKFFHPSYKPVFKTCSSISLLLRQSKYFCIFTLDFSNNVNGFSLSNFKWDEDWSLCNYFLCHQQLHHICWGFY